MLDRRDISLLSAAAFVPCQAERNWKQELQEESLDTTRVRLHLVTLWDVVYSGPDHG